MAVAAGSLLPRRDRLFGEFELLAKIATGGMAEIYLARRRQARTGLVVIKRVLPHLAEDPLFVRMFQDEARLSSLIEHPNVCQVYELGKVDHVWFLAMEYLPGLTMALMCQRFQTLERELDARIVTGIVFQCCAGLHHAHDLTAPDGKPLDVVHRDVSPANIFITDTGHVKLLDFGVAKARSATQRTNTGQLKGKNSYMSPEQILGKELDRRSDVFSLGICLYEGLTSSRLFARETDFLTFTAITDLDIPDIRKTRPDLPESLVAVIHKALSRDPEDRQATALEVADSLTAAMRGQGGIATPAEIADLLAREFEFELSARKEILDAIEADQEEIGDYGDFHVDTGLVQSELAASAPRRSSKWWVVAVAGVATLAAALVGVVVGGSGDGDAAAPSVRQTAVTPPAAVADAAPGAVAPAPIAPDAAAEVAAAAAPDAAPAVVDNRPGLFSVDSQPWATIYANGKNLGATPLFRVKLAPGSYKIRAVDATGRSQTFRIAIKPGRTLSKGRLRWPTP